MDSGCLEYSKERLLEIRKKLQILEEEGENYYAVKRFHAEIGSSIEPERPRHSVVYGWTGQRWRRVDQRIHGKRIEDPTDQDLTERPKKKRAK